MFSKTVISRLALLCIAPVALLLPASASVINGPMLTHTTMHSTLIWLQLSGPEPVTIEYWPADQPESSRRTALYHPRPEDAFVVKVLVNEGIQPGHRYHYRILTGEDEVPFTPQYRSSYRPDELIPLTFQSKPRWRWVPNPETRERHTIFDYRIAIGSCAYINEPGTDREGSRPYGDEYHIFESIYEKNPDLMLWMGDNVYYRENDFENREGMIHRWTHDRAIPELRPLLASSIHYAIWDDHDYGPNDIGSSYHLKETATEVFNLMWGNPSAGLPETPGLFTFVNWGDANIYFLDNRTHQDSFTDTSFGHSKKLLGRPQIDWLINHLAWTKSQSLTDSKSYPARFNLIVIGSQVLNDSGPGDGLRNYPEEWQYLMDRITAEQIPNVIFLNGDVHYGEVNRVEHTYGETSLTMFEVTSSPLTAGPWAGKTTNPARYDIFPDGMDRVGQRNFVTLDFEGPLTDRRMVIRYWDSQGNLLNQQPGGEPGQPTPRSIIRAQ
ncbi:MAG: alkaline phosphatase D family protein [Puniceicoccaceae bacterium]